MEGVAEFDSALFGVTASEAELMDPQQRLLLQVRLLCCFLNLESLTRNFVA